MLKIKFKNADFLENNFSNNSKKITGKKRFSENKLEHEKSKIFDHHLDHHFPNF